MTSSRRFLRAGGVLVVLLLAIASLPLGAQASSSAVSDRPTGGRYSLLSFSASPFMSIPLGADAAVFSLGGGSDLLVAYASALASPRVRRGPARVWLRPLRRSRYDPLHYQPRRHDRGAAGPPSLPLPERLRWGRLLPRPPQRTGRLRRRETPIFTGGIRLDFDVADSWSVGVGGAYRYFGGLFGDTTVAVAGTYHLPALAVGRAVPLPAGFTPLSNDGRGLRVTGLQAEPVFPVFSKYYDEHPLARVVLRNFEGVPAEGSSSRPS